MGISDLWGQWEWLYSGMGGCSWSPGSHFGDMSLETYNLSMDLILGEQLKACQICDIMAL